MPRRLKLFLTPHRDINEGKALLLLQETIRLSWTIHREAFPIASDFRPPRSGRGAGRPGIGPRLQTLSPGLRRQCSPRVRRASFGSCLTLKVELTCKLQAASRVGGVDSSEARVAEVGIRHEEVRMVECVKEFKAELET